jgi:diaminopimelate decarboxylase
VYLHGTSRINEKGRLEIGGCDTVELAERFGTPLFVYDEALIRQTCREFHEAFRRSGFSYQVAYASKAFCTTAMCRLAAEEGMSLDVVSAGELYTALKADFPVDRIHFHGNNKTPDEIRFALQAGVGCFVVDNFYELDLLDSLAGQAGVVQNVLLRITPGVEAHTHEYVQTGKQDTKFGFDLGNGQAEKAVKTALKKKNIALTGLHSHIGSQIFETTGFTLAVDRMVAFYAWIVKSEKVPLSVLNLGGGFGIRYTAEDDPLPVARYVEAITDEVARAAAVHGIEKPEIWIEPGRSIVGPAGTTLYTVGSRKEIPDVRTYVAVDGGMTDNPRPALYQAKYEAMVANKANRKPRETVSVAGKCCESGDMLIWDVELPELEPNDILAVSCTGAYNYSMASNYNRIPRPAVVFVYEGRADLVVRRESLEDIVQNDLIPDRMKAKAAAR